jgi:hypothetical protein
MHKVQLHSWHFLQNIIGVIKSETKEQGRWQAGATREVSAGFGGET